MDQYQVWELPEKAEMPRNSTKITKANVRKLQEHLYVGMYIPVPFVDYTTSRLPYFF